MLNASRNPIWLAGVGWTLLVLAAAAISISASYESMLEQARVAARVAFEKDLTFRRWNANLGGIYAIVTDQNRPNEFLTVPDRDLQTVDGRTLTMINPAYMSRQAYELQKYTVEVQGHITSLDPIRPGNKADPWEYAALHSFGLGQTEVYSQEILEGKPYMRIMRPVFIEENCLRCHAKQGYKVGEIRGGITVSVPMASHFHEFRTQMVKTVAGHGLIWAIGLMGIVTVGNRLRRSIQQEREARVAAEAAAKAKSEFLANMSHEIRTPLNGMLGMLQILRSENTPEEQASFLSMAYDSGNRLLALLNDILDFSKLEAGEMQLNCQPFYTRDLLDSAASVFQATCAERGLDLVMRPDPAMPEVLIGDEARLRQVLFHLLGNAIKFTPSGSVMVESWARPQLETPGKVRFYLAISDTGIGIPDDKVALMFEHFTQVEGSFTRKYQGAGLGLAIVKRTLSLMDGSITVSSESDIGTTIFVQVLLEQPAKPPAELCELAAWEAKASGRDRLRLLLVEDEEISRLSTLTMLKRAGNEVVWAENGQTAVEAFRAAALRPGGGFDCVLMDIQMPVMNGIEATLAIRTLEREEKWPRTRIVAVTAYALPGDRERFLEAGMDDYLPKPVRMEDLKQALRRVQLMAEA